MGTGRGAVSEIKELTTASVRRDSQDADMPTFVEHLWASSAADVEPFISSEHGNNGSDLGRGGRSHGQCMVPGLPLALSISRHTYGVVGQSLGGAWTHLRRWGLDVQIEQVSDSCTAFKGQDKPRLRSSLGSLLADSRTDSLIDPQL